MPPPIPLPAARDGLLAAIRDLRRSLGVLEAALLDYFDVESQHPPADPIPDTSDDSPTDQQ